MIIAAPRKNKEARKAYYPFPPEFYAKKEEPSSNTKHRMISTMTTI